MKGPALVNALGWRVESTGMGLGVGGWGLRVEGCSNAAIPVLALVLTAPATCTVILNGHFAFAFVSVTFASYSFRSRGCGDQVLTLARAHIGACLSCNQQLHNRSI